MKPAFLQRRRPHSPPRSGERGITMVLVAISMVAIIAMAAWSIDLVTLYLARQEAQRAADAGALAAARVISVSGITGTGDPDSQPAYWSSICGGPNSAASQAAQAVAGQNSIGSNVGSVTVTYSTYGTGAASNADCTPLGTVFAINPLVTVQVKRTDLPSFFSRMWKYTSQSVSATATAEAFNPSASDTQSNGATTGDVIPVQPRCVKPWMVPNLDPMNPLGCTSATCKKFVSNGDGSIVNDSISTGGGSGNGVIGETFTLFADCNGATIPCAPTLPPGINIPNGAFNGNTAPPNMGYLPGEVLYSAVAVPSCATSGGGGVSAYEPAVAGCDQSTVYQCGVQSSSAVSPGNAVDLSENPTGGTGDTATALACSLTGQSSAPISGQDTLDTGNYPFKITAGDNNRLKIPSGTLITGSNQIVSFPIYDQGQGFAWVGNRSAVTIVGFLEVFINWVDANGNISVTVLNVAGCGNGANKAPDSAITGSSPVPVRLITGQ